MKTIKGPAVFLAQFVDKKAPFNSLDKTFRLPSWQVLKAPINVKSVVLPHPEGPFKSTNSPSLIFIFT